MDFERYCSSFPFFIRLSILGIFSNRLSKLIIQLSKTDYPFIHVLFWIWADYPNILSKRLSILGRLSKYFIQTIIHFGQIIQIFSPNDYPFGQIIQIFCPNDYPFWAFYLNILVICEIPSANFIQCSISMTFFSKLHSKQVVSATGCSENTIRGAWVYE